MATLGCLQIPDELLDREHALDLLGRYFRRDEDGLICSGATFGTYPRRSRLWRRWAARDSGHHHQR